MSLPEVPNAEKVSEVAEEVGSSASDLEEVVTSVSAEWGKLPAVYEAPESEVVYDALSSLPDRENHVSQATTTIRRALDDYATALKTLESDRASLQEWQTGLENNDLPQGLVDAERSELNTSISQLYTRLDQEDEDCARRIRNISGVGKDGDAYIPLLQSTAMSGTYLQYLQNSGSVYAQTQLAEAYATMLLEDGLEGELDEETLEQFNEFLATVTADGETSSRVLDQLGGERLVALMSVAAMGVANSARGGPVGGQQMADSLKTLLRMGDRWNTDNGAPRKSEKLAQEMVAYISGEEGEQYSLYRSSDIYGLSYLLHENTLSTPFLLEIGQDLEAMEQGFENGINWRQLTNAPATGGALLFAPENMEAAFDPMASYMSALGKNSEASLKFFTPYDSDKAIDRQEYWIQKRRWSHDEFDSLMTALDAAITHPDNVDKPAAIGLASSAVEFLANRTLGVPEITDEGKLVREDGQLSREEIRYGDDAERIAPGTLSDSASVKLVHILGTHMDAVERSIPLGDAKDHLYAGELWEREGRTPLARFYQPDLDVLLQSIFDSEQGSAAMRLAVLEHQETALVNKIENTSGDTEAVLEVVRSSQIDDATLEGYVLSNMAETMITNGQEKDEAIERWINLGAGAVEVVPAGKIFGQGASYLDTIAGQVIKQGKSGLIDSWTNNEANAVNTAEQSAQAATPVRNAMLVKILYENGTITDDDLIGNPEVVENMSREEYEEYFANGFPSDVVLEIPELRYMVQTIAGEHHGFDVNMFQYETQLGNEMKPFFK